MNNKIIILEKKMKLMNYQLLILFVLTLLLFGALLNTFAVSVNGGKMPVLSSNDYETSTHFTFQDKKEINNFEIVDIININGTM